MRNVVRINRLSDIAELKKSWNELLNSSDADRLFLSWEWMFSWCKHRSVEEDLFLLVVTGGDNVVAIAPFVLRKPSLRRLKLFRSLNFMATDVVGSDYMDILIRKGEERAAVRAIAGYLNKTGLSLELSHIGPDSKNARKLSSELNARRWSVVRREVEVCPYVNLAGHCWDSYLKSLGSSHRANIRRKIRKAHGKFNVEVSVVVDNVSLDWALNQMVMLHYKRHGDATVSDAFTAKSVLEFHKEISQLSLNRECLRLYVMTLDDTPVAALYGFLVEGKFYFYQSGFDPFYAKYSVGLLLLSHTIEQAISDGAHEYDLLHGNEKYKYLWASDQRVLQRLYIFPPTVSGGVSRRIFSIKQWVKGRAAGLFKS